MVLGVRPCSTRVTTRALNITDSSREGSRPFTGDGRLDGGPPAGPAPPCAASQARPEVATHGEEGRGVDVPAAADEHIVAAPKDALRIARPPTPARVSLDAHDVTAEKAHD